MTSEKDFNRFAGNSAGDGGTKAPLHATSRPSGNLDTDISGGPRPYICMPRAELADGKLTVRAVQSDDIEAIRQWRNAQMDVLRQKSEISSAQRIEYFRQKIWPDKLAAQPGNILLAILRDGDIIGYGGLVHIAWEHKRAEISFLLAPELEQDANERAELFAGFLGLMKILAFDDLGMARLFAETYAFRTQHIETLERCGFLCEGRQRHHVRIGGTPVDSLIHGVLAIDERGRHEG